MMEYDGIIEVYKDGIRVNTNDMKVRELYEVEVGGEVFFLKKSDDGDVVIYIESLMTKFRKWVLDQFPKRLK